MRLIHAVTASDLQNSGHPYGTIYAAWRRIIKTPLYTYINEYGAMQASGNGLYAYQRSIYLSLPVGQAAKSWKSNEWLSCGYYLMKSNNLPNNASSALIVASSAGEEVLCTWNQLFPYTDDGESSYIEYRVSYDLKTAIIMVNGRKVKTVTLTFAHTRETLNMYFFCSPNQVSNWVYIKDIYAAFFDPAVEKPYLTRWICEELVVGASDFPNSVVDDNVRDTLNDTAKNIEFTYAGANKPKAAVISGYGFGNFSEVLEAKVKSGSVETTLVTEDMPTVLTDNYVGANLAYGLLVGGVDFDNTSKKVTATLKLNR